ncbi:MAG: hemolysin III family protein [Acidimicrobiales bacterium]|nr:hemolysin III [Actinomycetota bacterium]MDP6062023.1 hemolysin III family protein [Acidimicrobiales bacterium]MDP7209914.1 hemolysin III family protein [Acidimicrobiales bacterium]HJP00116.1 hemolysin III family protein [Acidimicrobiales bacterium]
MVDAHNEVPGNVSESVRRSLVHGRPLWRGVMHRAAVPLTVAGGAALVWETPPGADRLGAGVFAVGALLMFVASALVHLRRWSIPVWELLFRFDHAAIFILIAASATPVAVSSLEGRSARLLLWATWIGAAIGVTLRMLPFHPPRGLMNTLFLSLGWVPIMVAPDLFRALDTSVLLLIVIEGLLYSGGAIMLGVRWPDLSPRVFGYHEVWHALVTTAVVIHFVVVAMIVGAG